MGVDMNNWTSWRGEGAIASLGFQGEISAQYILTKSYVLL